MRRSPFRVVADEARAFRDALEAAPEPGLTRDLWGIRRLLRKLIWLLWHEKTGPGELGVAVFLGVLVGCSPFYGLHTALVLALGFGLGLNKIVLWVASNVSLPFIAPFIAFGSMHVGHYMLYGGPLPMSLSRARAMVASGSIVEVGVSLWLYWLAGSLVVGAALGAAFAVPTWALARRRERRRSVDVDAAPTNE